jgi:hypothetical protein
MTADEYMENLESTGWLELFAELDTPESKLKFEQYCRFLQTVIYAGLTDLNTGFDSPLVGHFSPADFFIVIDRCESLGVEVIGIECSRPTWSLRQRRGSKISKSRLNPATTGRAYWSASTWRGALSPSVRPSVCLTQF